jgi:histidyl-tRNA synthetase
MVPPSSPPERKGKQPIRAVKGMNDILPDEIARWHRVEAAYARTMALHGFREVRTPYVEPTALFTHAIGEATDIVEKEMYSFTHHDEALTLRPEGTAGAARAYVEHGVHTKEPVSRWYYSGAMFRAERPQRGRYRQFYQLGAEIFGDPGPGCDAELIDMLAGFLNDIEVPGVEVLVNSLGGPQARARYREALVSHLTPRKDSLSQESQRRLGPNPLRILDSKSEADQAAVADAPSIHAFFDDADRAHFDALQRYLSALGTPYRVEPRLVRGLDYYMRTLFELKGAKAKLGAGDTLLGGGRYDGMVGELGGPAVPAIGFAAGLERLLIASDAAATTVEMDAFVAPLGPSAVEQALALGRELRKAGIPCEVDTRGSSLKSQLRRANALGVRVVLILGDSELAEGVVQLKDLHGHTQDRVARDKVVPIVVDRLVAASRGVDSHPPQGRGT